MSKRKSAADVSAVKYPTAGDLTPVNVSVDLWAIGAAAGIIVFTVGGLVLARERMSQIHRKELAEIIVGATSGIAQNVIAIKGEKE
jgi:hypothetical protein